MVDDINFRLRDNELFRFLMRAAVYHLLETDKERLAMDHPRLTAKSSPCIKGTGSEKVKTFKRKSGANPQKR